MLKVHHLNNSRSQRIVWLMEELGTPYEIVPYRRDATTNLAPPELKAVHPLGKSPVIVDGDIVIAESGAIVEYAVARYGDGRLRPDPASSAHVAYLEWLHYSEGSAMLPLMMNLYLMRLGEAGAPLHERVASEIDNNLAYIAGALGDKDHLLGAFTGADLQMSFVMEVARAFGKLGAYPTLAAYIARLQARPAFQRSIEKGGAYNLAG
ncbi:MAG TPA: glutathione S-transferase [Caulobacteraceae bacterium]|nr:glutathione S-transferase [Caulobacteraceae bacterium]